MTALIILIAAAVLVAADQVIKHLIVSSIAYGASVVILPGIVDFTYIHNNGAAFGMLQGRSWVLLSINSVIILFCLSLVLKNSLKSNVLKVAVTLVLAGGIGNLIDRIFNGGNVVDFIELKFVDFAIFNFADCCITIGAVLIILDFILELIKDYKIRKKNEEEIQ